MNVEERHTARFTSTTSVDDNQVLYVTSSCEIMTDVTTRATEHRVQTSNKRHHGATSMRCIFIA
jgi:hypothetical protein